MTHVVLAQRGWSRARVPGHGQGLADSPILTTACNPAGIHPESTDHDVHNSPLQRTRALRRHFRAGRPLYPWAFRKLGPVDAEVVLSSGPRAPRQLRASGARHQGALGAPVRAVVPRARHRMPTNLGGSFAGLGVHTLLVDGELRRPRSSSGPSWRYAADRDGKDTPASNGSAGMFAKLLLRTGR